MAPISSSPTGSTPAGKNPAPNCTAPPPLAQAVASLVDELIISLCLQNRQPEGKLNAVNWLVHVYSNVINYQTQLLSDMEELLMKHNIPLPGPFLASSMPSTPPPSPQ
ncbi:hypothetical protein EST38_g5468 [Candolleomyces aberdarensis]|uniref:Uncharacterized protein n=1 Tax=Candolleomyces aberdarensis TaxID=2316362 RepID=A0A4Q2DM41_9AGAR|nr:hypothetical protein EST38_g5468 [Candolleomyces aberdarensis]